MLKSLFTLLLYIVVISPGFAMSKLVNDSLLVFDNLTFKVALRNFRSPQWDLDNPPLTYVQGLSNLNASASGQFSQKSLLRSFEDRELSKILIVDLRMESHGFINGQAVSWYGSRNINNSKLSLQEIIDKEQNLLNSLTKEESVEVAYILKKTSGIIQQSKSETVVPNHVESEKDLTKRLGFQYVRMPVLDRHPPTYDTIDQLLTLVESLPKETWLHFHCRAGKGRATTFLVLYDIIQNGADMSLTDILDRQSYFGPKDLRQLPTKKEDLWKIQPAKDRLRLVQEFHRYRNSPDFGKVTWSGWKRAQS